MCPHDFDVALCGITFKNVALSFSLVGNPLSRMYSLSDLPYLDIFLLSCIHD